MLRFLALFILLSPCYLYADIFLSSPKISLNSQDQRVIELKIQNDDIEDGDIVLYEYKTDNLIDESDIAYTLIEDFENSMYKEDFQPSNDNNCDFYYNDSLNPLDEPVFKNLKVIKNMIGKQTLKIDLCHFLAKNRHQTLPKFVDFS